MILRNVDGGEGDPQFKNCHSTQNNAVVLYATFRVLTDANVIKFKELFEQGGYLHLGKHKKIFITTIFSPC